MPPPPPQDVEKTAAPATITAKIARLTIVLITVSVASRRSDTLFLIHCDLPHGTGLSRMIVHLATARGANAVTKHLWYRPSLNSRVQSVRYEDVLAKREWARGVYLFTDSERMTGPQKSYASWLHDRLSERPDAFCVLNHPVRHTSRFDLLRRLYLDGVNAFNVHRITEIEDARYPLFLRYEDRHIGSSTPLLRSRAEVDDWVMRLAAEGEELDRLIAVEFVDTADAAGHYRKYGAFRIGPHIVPRHMFVSTHWEVKIDTNNLSAFRRREEYAYLRENSYSDQVMRAFDTAGLEYGRIDFAVIDGKIQVWEVNDNPQMTSSLARYWKGRLGRCLYSLKNLDFAFGGVESSLEPGPAIQLDAREHNVWRALCTP